MPAPRRTSRPRWLAAWLAIIAIGLGSIPILPLAAADNLVHDLGTLPGDDYSTALALNATGAVVGWSGLDFGYARKRAFLWDNATMTDLGSLGGTQGTWATDINALGQIVGSSHNASNYERPFLWENGQMTELNVAALQGGATAINDVGQIVGWRLARITDPNDPYADRAFLWANGKVKDLGTLAGFRNSYATGINNAGQVVGYVQDPRVRGPVRAFLWDPAGGMRDLGSLPGDSLAEASHINEAGEVVGWSGDYGVSHATLWQGNASRALAGSAGNTSARGINNMGQVVGANGTAVVWHGGNETVLPSLVPGLRSVVNDVNDAGTAAGQSDTGSGIVHAVLWEQVVPVHDVGVTASVLNPYPTVGEIVLIDVVGRNHGNRPETFDLSANVGPYVVGNATVSVPASASTTIRLNWNTAGIPAGTYSLNATATPVAGETNLSDNVFRNENAIIVFLRLAAVPTASTSETDVAVPILFTCNKTDRAAPYGPYRFSWTFGDGTQASGDRVTHMYAIPGMQTATCTVTEDNGESASAPVRVQIQPRPSLQATADRVEASPATPITFSATATGGSGRYLFDWRFGDGGIATGATVVHAYATPGVYNAVATVGDTFGGTSPNNVSLRITIAAIAATTTLSQRSAEVGVLITFIADAHGGAGGPYRYFWDFGDGVTLAGSPVTHAYPRPGSYVPKVTITDAAGKSAVFILPPVTIGASGLGGAAFGMDQDTTKVVLGVLVVVGVTVGLFSVRRIKPRKPRAPKD